MYLLGIEIGSSFVEVSLVESETGGVVTSAISPKEEMEISAPEPGFAEQDPAMWWENVVQACKEIREQNDFNPANVKAIGIAYQMHALVVIDEAGDVLRPAILANDDRAYEIGAKYFEILGEENCLLHLLNSPGNFTASKLKWVMDNEPEIYERIHKMMLPGDYIAYKMTGKFFTTITGLSEATLWDFESTGMSDTLLDEMGIGHSLIPTVKETFDKHGLISAEAAELLGLAAETPISYKAGDQPNNALSLNVTEPGEVAATAGTRGVVYGVTEKHVFDRNGQVNIFAHVNHQVDRHRLGVLLRLKDSGDFYSRLRKRLKYESYEEMNELGAMVGIGAEGLTLYPFGFDAEQILEGDDFGGLFTGLQSDIHSNAHLIRACQEGIAFSLRYGMDVMRKMNTEPNTVVHARNTKLFLSPLFREVFANVTNLKLELYDTNGAKGAAIGAGIGAEIYTNVQDAMAHLTRVEEIEPDEILVEQYQAAYENWLANLPGENEEVEEDEF